MVYSKVPMEHEVKVDRPSSVQHGYRISLNLTRRVIRRVIEFDDYDLHPHMLPTPRLQKSHVPDSESFQFSLRVLRRVIRRMLNVEMTKRPILST